MVLRLCDENDKAKELNDYFRTTLQDHISKTIVPRLQNLKEEILLQAFVKQWNNYTILVHFMRKMFNYLDRYYLKNTNMQALAMSSLQFFKEKCFTVLQDNLRQAVLNQITKDRDGEQVDWDLLKSSISAFVQMGYINADIIKSDDEYVWKGDKNLTIYETQFEKQLINRSKDEYQQKSAGWMGRLNCPEYLREVEKHLLKEEERS
jgi:cullin 1